MKNLNPLYLSEGPLGNRIDDEMITHKPSAKRRMSTQDVRDVYSNVLKNMRKERGSQTAINFRNSLVKIGKKK